MWFRVALVRTDDLEECISSIIRVKRISELGTVTSNWSALRRNTDSHRNVGPYESHTASHPRRQHSLHSLPSDRIVNEQLIRKDVNGSRVHGAIWVRAQYIPGWGEDRVPMTRGPQNASSPDKAPGCSGRLLPNFAFCFVFLVVDMWHEWGRRGTCIGYW
jgi:hypothetical protein